MNDTLRIRYEGFRCNVGINQLIELTLPKYRRLLRYFFTSATQAEVRDLEEAITGHVNESQEVWAQASKVYVDGFITMANGYSLKNALAQHIINKKEMRAIKRKNNALKEAVKETKTHHERWKLLYKEYEIIKEKYYYA